MMLAGCREPIGTNLCLGTCIGGAEGFLSSLKPLLRTTSMSRLAVTAIRFSAIFEYVCRVTRLVADFVKRI